MANVGGLGCGGRIDVLVWPGGGVFFFLVGAGVSEGVGCNWMVTRVDWGCSGLMWVGVMMGAWVGPMCVCLGIGQSRYMRVWWG